MCVSGGSPARRRPCVGSSSNSIDGGDPKVCGKTKIKGEDWPTPSKTRSFDLVSCTTPLKPDSNSRHSLLNDLRQFASNHNPQRNYSIEYV